MNRPFRFGDRFALRRYAVIERSALAELKNKIFG
jgi:hypothetical protein